MTDWAEEVLGGRGAAPAAPAASPEKDKPKIDWANELLSSQPRQNVTAPQPQATTAPVSVEDRAKQMFGFEDYAKRGTILPFGITKEGKTEIATPQVVKDLMTSALLPGHAAKGGEFSAQDVAKFTLDYGVPATQRSALVAQKATPTRKEFIKSAPTSKEQAAISSDFYKAAEGSGVTVHPDSYKLFLENVGEKLKQEGFDKKLNPQIASTLKAFSEKEGAPMTFQDLNIARKQVNDAVGSTDAATRRLGHILQDELDKYVENLGGHDLSAGSANDALKAASDLNKARIFWASSRKMNTIETAMKNAQLAASGFENGIRMEFRRILKSDRKSRGFTEEEKKLMKDIVVGYTSDKILRLLGKFSLIRSDAGNMFGGTIGASAGAAVGSSIAGAPGAAIGAMVMPTVGVVGQKAAERATVGRADLLRAMAAHSKNLPEPRIDELKKAILASRGLGPLIGSGGLQNGK